MRTVVTGGAGFIGVNLVKALIEQGREVVAADIAPPNIALQKLSVPFLHADLRDFNQALKVVEDADAVYHLAAKVGSVEYLHGSPLAELDALQTNMVIDINVMKACLESKVQKIIYTSSAGVYPIHLQQNQGARFAEDDIKPINPDGGYGWAKLIGEISLDLHGACKSGIARIFNAYGEYSELGENAQVIPALIRKAVNYPNEPFTVWGDGTPTRNFIYIKDCINALLKLEQYASYPPLKVNIGNPNEMVTIKQLAEKIVTVSGKKIPITFDPKMPRGCLSRTPDIKRASIELDWKPETPLQEGLEHTYNWAEQFLNHPQ